MASALGGFSQVALTEGGPAATFAPAEERHLKAERFQHPDRGDADVWLVIAHKGIIPQEDLAAARVVAGATVFEPAIESLGGVMGKRPLPGEADGLGEETAHHERIEGIVGQAREPAAGTPQPIHGAEDALAQRQAVAPKPG